MLPSHQQEVRSALGWNPKEAGAHGPRIGGARRTTQQPDQASCSYRPKGAGARMSRAFCRLGPDVRGQGAPDLEELIPESSPI